MGLQLFQMLGGQTRLESGSAFRRATVEDLNTDIVRVSLQLAFLANQACEMLHAITVTLVRLGITKHRLLEWETAAASSHRGGPPRLGVFLKDMIASPLVAIGSLVLVLIVRQHAPPFPTAPLLPPGFPTALCPPPPV